MPGIFFIQPRQVCHTSFLLSRIPHVPVAHQFLPIGVCMRHEYDHIIQYPYCFLIIPAQQLIGSFNELVYAYRFSGMQTSVNPNNRFTKFR